MTAPVDSWQHIPVVSGRLATEADFISAVAIFHQGGGGEPYVERQLPALAIAKVDGERPRSVVVVQIEKTNKGFVVCGARYLEDGGDLVCALEDLEFQEKAG